MYRPSSFDTLQSSGQTPPYEAGDLVIPRSGFLVQLQVP